MSGVTLSRWTMSYFALAVLCLLGAEALMALGVGYPADGPSAPLTLALVHLVTIGWLSLLMCGALFQFVPVLVANPIASNSLPLPTLLLLAAGLGLLLCGFVQLTGIDHGPAFSLLPWGGGLLGLGFLLAIANLAVTLWRARPLNLPALFVTGGLLSLAATALFGLAFTFLFGGVVLAPPLARLAAGGLSLHIIAGLGGWLTFTAMGVSYRLLAMFMLAPELDGATTRWAQRLGAAALVVAIVGGALAVLMQANVGAVLLAAGLPGVAALGLYGRDIRSLYRQRRRRVIELNSRMAAVALGHLAAVVVLAVILVAGGWLDDRVAGLLFLVAFGWLSGLGLAKLYKIMAFVTWLECYGPVLGKVMTPRVQDLVVEPRARRWFWLYFAGVDVGVVALLGGWGLVFRIAAAVMLVATAAIAGELVRTRRLADVPADKRLPAGVERPRLLLAAVRKP